MNVAPIFLRVSHPLKAPFIVAGIMAILLPASCGRDELPTPSPSSGRTVSVDEILPADVLSRVNLLGDELELIRFEMGLPEAERFDLAVSHVTPRDAIFQAFTLLGNANQLRYELTGAPETELDARLPPDIRPYHVWKVVDAALKRVRSAKRELGIDDRIAEKPQSVTMTPDDVFRAIFRANRQLDALLNDRLSTGDVFQQVSLATRYASRLLAQFPNAKAMPEAPAFKHGQRPVDVYNLLAQCYTRLYDIAERSGVGALELETAIPDMGIADPARIRPSEVYDVATLLVSELEYLHSRLRHPNPPHRVTDSGLKVPAHVYQQAGILLLQLVELEDRVDANPEWLTDS